MRHLVPEVSVPLNVSIMGAVFFLFFVGVVFFVYSSAQTKKYERASKLPLED
jgi:cbb3-type cytochrome oxidase subunit 3